MTCGAGVRQAQWTGAPDTSVAFVALAGEARRDSQSLERSSSMRNLAPLLAVAILVVATGTFAQEPAKDSKVAPPPPGGDGQTGPGGFGTPPR
jgi:hypothetical protein